MVFLWFSYVSHYQRVRLVLQKAMDSSSWYLWMNEASAGHFLDGGGEQNAQVLKAIH